MPSRTHAFANPGATIALDGPRSVVEPSRQAGRGAAGAPRNAPASPPITVAPSRRLVTLSGETTVEELLFALERHGLTFPFPVADGRTVAEAVQSGGYGPLIGRFGLSADHLSSAVLQRRDGSPVHASDQDDLLWLLRGGGRDAKIAALTLEVQSLPMLWFGTVFVPADRYDRLLEEIGIVCAAGSEQLTLSSGICSGPAGSPHAFVAALWSGQDAAPPDHFAMLGKDAMLSGLRLRPKTPSATFLTLNALLASRSMLGSFRLRSLGADVRDVVQTIAGSRPSGCALAMQEFFGAATRVPRWSTGFEERRAHLRLDLRGSRDPRCLARNLDWRAKSAALLSPHLLPATRSAEEDARHRSASARIAAMA